jgi:ATP-binding cassette subfamily B protein
VFWALKLPALGTQLSSLAHRYAPFRNVLLRLLEPLSSPEEANPSGSVAASAASRASKVPCAIQIRAGKVRAGGHTILEDVNLQITPGEHVAIVGSSGAGKSTLLGLLLGWHRLSEGRLDIDGRALSGQAQQNLRRSTAWVDPSVQLWNQTFFDNLTYACEQQEFKQMSEVLEKARLRQVLQKLPEGLQTWLGEGGALLSGGEGQRVRLARALMQSDVRLALLDEPFRGLDRGQRMALMAEARVWWKNATLLCVTHDVAETLNFKRVLVVENGRIVEDGSPASLAAGSSRYRELLEVEQQVRERLWSGEHWRRIRIEQGMVVEGGKIVAAEVRT